ncbi:hypothetical protein [Deinococcus sp. QL22]|uniref:hypothetical protein n=1 Tax=Deinococcus sp. QL22 TaxID=2939437 RepID=UPI0020174679|nr:hypothetical protein [Deinococcus sp. QL22]UQN05504.1 hypothetical protein M1R55_11520 [Deinococcus sp. QL22]
MTPPPVRTITITHDPVRNALVRRLLAGALPYPLSASPTPTVPTEARHEQSVQKKG